MVKGESVDYLGVSEQDSQGTTWYKVQYYSYGTGWVTSQYSKLVGAASGNGGSAYVQASGGNVNIRSFPSLDGEDRGTLKEGSKAEFLGMTSVDDRGVTWYKVEYKDIIGWASSRYSKLVGGSSSGSSDIFLPDLGVSGGYVMAEGGDVNIRSNPSLDGKVLGTIHEGETASYLNSRSTDERGVTWYKANFEGTVGWVSARYSTLLGNGSVSLPEFYTSIVKAVGGDCNIRTQPNLNGSSIGVMKKGESGTYLNQSSVDERGVTWYKVKFEGETGWISSRYSDIF